jgi:hypothetical protein
MRKVTSMLVAMVALFAACTCLIGATNNMGYDTSKVGLLIKFDDLWSLGPWNTGTRQAHKFAIDYCLDSGLKCSEGIFAHSLTNATAAPYNDFKWYLDRLLDATNRENFELWLHGWSPFSTRHWDQNIWDWVYEDQPAQTFSSGNKVQRAMFFDSQRELINRFGMVFRTWGPHYWGPDSDTGWLFNRDPLINVWFRYSDGAATDIWPNQYNWKHVYEPHYRYNTNDSSMEPGTYPCVNFDAGEYLCGNSTQCRSMESFRAAIGNAKGWYGYTNATNDVAEFVVQGHPHEWPDYPNGESWVNFFQIVDWIAAQTNIETRLPSYCAVGKDFSSRTISAPSGTVTNISVYRMTGTDRIAYLLWDPVYDGNGDMCLAYVIRRDGEIVGFGKAEEMDVPFHTIRCVWIDKSESLIADGAKYTMQPVSGTWVMGTNSAEVAIPNTTLPSDYIDLLGTLSPFTILEGQATQGSVDIVHRANSTNQIVLSLSDGLPNRGWSWLDSGSNQVSLTMAPNERRACRFEFDGTATNEMLRSIILSNASLQTVSTNMLSVEVFQLEARFVPSDFDNYTDSDFWWTNTESIASTRSVTAPYSWTNAPCLHLTFDGNNFLNKSYLLARAATTAANEGSNTFIVSLRGDWNKDRSTLWNVPTTGNENWTTNLVTTCWDWNTIELRDASVNLGAAFKLWYTCVDMPNMTFGGVNTLDPRLHYLNFDGYGPNTLYFGFPEPLTSMHFVELWSAVERRQNPSIAITTTLQCTNIAGGWTDVQSVTDVDPVTPVFYWAKGETNGGVCTIEPKRSVQSLGHWTAVPTRTNVIWNGPYFQFKTEVTRY